MWKCVCLYVTKPTHYHISWLGLTCDLKATLRTTSRPLFNSRSPSQPNLQGSSSGSICAPRRKQRWEWRMGFLAATSWSSAGTSSDPCPCRECRRGRQPGRSQKQARSWESKDGLSHLRIGMRKSCFSLVKQFVQIEWLINLAYFTWKYFWMNINFCD